MEKNNQSDQQNLQINNIKSIEAPQQIEGATKTTKNSSNKFLVPMVILSILAVAGVGVGIYGLASKHSQVSHLEQEILGKDQEILDLKDKIAGKNPGSAQNPKPDDGTDTSDTDIASTASSMLLTSPEQILTDNDKSPVRLTQTSFFGGTGVYLDKQIGGAIDMSAFGESSEWIVPTTIRLSANFEQINGWEKVIDDEITGVDVNKVVQVFVNGYGNGGGYETVFMLMDDGTVEYVPLAEAFDQGEFKSWGKLPNVENVVKLMSADYNHGGPYGPSVNTMAQRADGKVYFLGAMVEQLTQ